MYANRFGMEKQNRKALTLKVKYEIIYKKSEIGTKLELEESLVAIIWKNREELKLSAPKEVNK